MLLDILRARPLCVLVIDSTHAASGLVTLLKESGQHAYVASDPEAALKTVQVVPPDAILLNLGLLPNAYKLADQLRTMMRKRPLLVALADSGHAADRERSRRGGFDRHLVRPLKVETLLWVLAEHADQLLAKEWSARRGSEDLDEAVRCRSLASANSRQTMSSDSD